MYDLPFVTLVSSVNRYTLRTPYWAFGPAGSALGMEERSRGNETFSRAWLDRCHRDTGLTSMHAVLPERSAAAYLIIAGTRRAVS